MTPRLRNAHGFTLAELLIVVAVLGFMMGALFTLQQQGQLAYLTGAARVEVQQNARIALDMMVNDLRAAQPVTGSVTRVLSSIDANCNTGTPPTSGGGTSLAFTDQFSKTVTYQISGTDLQRVYNGTTEVLVGGVQGLQIWCYNAGGALDSNLDNIREVLIQIQTKTERTAQAGSPGDQHAVVEGRVRFRNI
jgi:prepilin-type N-terminal cleavage/methylation domain-containing protein